ncbi:hypothetical protein P154DRAFT_348081 [Amniculicola lignicola CBS 123094]|uniref:Uncharacterized protein n=1 Tax=Amniculicola lignicola CBS 123094 TaxID=1392246 RepID=A0A6A5W8E5_9PLEO|nr:hypothetical protein P154DRAFT_348081 [Amniculicola lignicola CBS 123094]
MADFPGPPYRKSANNLGPSNLRHEVHQTSTDDESGPCDSVIQVANSDIAVAETQYEDTQSDIYNHDNNGHDDEEFPLSPKTQKMLEKTAISKNQQDDDGAQMGMFLSRDAYGRPSSSDSTGFTFHSQPRGTQQPFTAEAAKPKQPTKPALLKSAFPVNIRDSNDSCMAQSQEPAAPQKFVPREDCSQQQHVAPSSNENHQEGGPVDESFSAGEAPTAMNEGTPAFPRASEPGPQSGQMHHPPLHPKVPTSKRSMGKKSKKSQKGLFTQQRGAPWPPRNPYEEPSTAKPVTAELDDQPILDVVHNSTVDAVPPSGQYQHRLNLARDATKQPFQPVPHGELAPHAPEERIASPVHAEGLDCQIVENPNQSPPLPEDEQEPHLSPMPSPNRRVGRDVSLGTSGRTTTQRSSHVQQNRVIKSQKQPRKVTGTRPRASPNVNIQSNALNTSLDSAFMTIRASVMATMARAEHEHGSYTKAQEAQIVALHDTNSILKDRVKALEITAAELRATISKKQEAGRNMQKFVKGIGDDYDRLKDAAKKHNNDCSGILREKIAEIDNEKESLIADFETTLETLEKRLRSMNATLKECDVRLRLSDTTKKVLTEELKSQKRLLEEEKKKRGEFEQQVLTCVQSLQRQMKYDSDGLLEKFTNMQALVEDAANDKTRDDCIKQCVDALKKLGGTTFLTADDVRKAERMLRFIHESVTSKLGNLSGTVTGIQLPTTDIQNHINGQFQTLRAEIVKYDEVNAEYHKTRQSKEHLEKELEQEKQESAKLGERLDAARQNEVGLQSRIQQLGMEMEALRDTPCDHERDMSKVDREISELRTRLRKTDEDLQLAKANLEEATRARQAHENESAKFKKTAEEQKARVTTILQREKKMDEELATVRESARKESLKKFQEKQATMGNDIHRLTRERAKMDDTLRTTTRELDATRDALQRARQDLHTFDCELKGLRKDNVEAEKKHKMARRLLKEKDTTSELATLAEELKQKNVTILAKEKELGTIKQEHETVQSQLAILRQTADHQKGQLSEQQSKIESIRKDTETRLAEERAKYQASVQESHKNMASVQKQNEDLRSRLEQTQADARSSAKDLQAGFDEEKKSLQMRTNELQIELQKGEMEAQGVRNEFEEEKAMMKEEFERERSDLQRRLAQSDAALKEAQAKVKNVNQNLGLDASSKSPDSGAQTRKVPTFSQTPTSRASVIVSTPSKGSVNIYVGRQKRKANRHEESTPTVTTSSQPRRLISSKSFGAQYEHPERVNTNGSVAQDLGQMERLSESGIHTTFQGQHDFVPETQEFESTMTYVEDVPETQPEFRASMPYAEIDREINTKKGKQPRALSSSDPLSEIDDERMFNLESEVTGQISQPTLQKANRQTPVRQKPAKFFVPSIQDRPTSHANTASRVAPPNYSPLKGVLQQADSFTRKSSPDLVHQRPSKVTYVDRPSSPSAGHEAGHGYEHSHGHSPRVLRTPKHGSTQKRKSPTSHLERSHPPKKRREAPAVLPSSSVTKPRRSQGSQSKMCSSNRTPSNRGPSISTSKVLIYDRIANTTSASEQPTRGSSYFNQF